MVTGIEKFPKRQVEGVTIIDETLLIPFKARPFLDGILSVSDGTTTPEVYFLSMAAG